MSEVGRLVALARKDALGIARDGLLLWLAVYPLVICGVLRVAVPWIPIDGIGLYVAPVATILAPSLIGMVLGFSLIEEREQDTWILLRVLPLHERTLFGYLGSVSVAAALVLSVASTAIYGRAPTDPALFAAVAFAGALTAPALAWILAAACADKIQGLALGKILSAASGVPLLAFVLAPGWQVLLMWSPWYWIYAGLLQAFAGPGELAALGRPVFPALPVWSLAGVPALQCLALAGLAARRLRRQIG